METRTATSNNKFGGELFDRFENELNHAIESHNEVIICPGCKMFEFRAAAYVCEYEINENELHITFDNNKELHIYEYNTISYDKFNNAFILTVDNSEVYLEFLK